MISSVQLSSFLKQKLHINVHITTVYTLCVIPLTVLFQVLKNKESLSHTLTEEEQGSLKKLQSLVTTSEMLKHQEQMFREQCQTELATIQQFVD